MLAIFAHKLIEPLVYSGEISFPVHQDVKEAAYTGPGASSPGRVC